MTDSIFLDVHAHLIPVDVRQLAAINGVEWRQDETKLVVDGHAIGLKKLFDPEALIRWMDEHDIAHAWISAPPPTYRPALGVVEAKSWANYLNRGLENIAGKSSGRLSQLVHLTIEHPSVAISICEIAIANGQSRFSMSAGGSGVLLSAPDYRPLWQALDEAGAFVFIHPGSACDPRLDPYYLENLFGNPVETAIAASHLVFGRVLERFSRIQFCLAHAGGVMPQIAGRLERGFETARPGIDTQGDRPARLLQRFCVDCIAHSADALHLAAKVFGNNNIVFGSDWPFPMGLPDPRQQLQECNTDLLNGILQTNPRRLLQSTKHATKKSIVTD